MLELVNVSYTKNKKTILHGLTANLKPGKIYSILGLNGSGKTTLLKILAAIWHHTSGDLKWQEEDLRCKSRKEISRLITMVPHNQPLAFGYHVWEIVNMGGYPSGLINDSSRVENALKSVGAWHLRDRPITQISNGERQRVLIARSLISETPVMLLDEPSTGLDIKHQVAIWRLILQLREKGKIIVVASHDLAMAKDVSDEVILLQAGHCVGIGMFEEIITPSVLENIFGVTEH